MTTIRFIFMLLLAGALGLSPGTSQTNPAPVRLAIIAEGVSTVNASDLLTSELSKLSGVQLLERDEIQRIYREQSLSAGSTDYLKLGKILGADGLLVIESPGENAGGDIALRLIAVKPGVMLLGERYASPSKNLKEWVPGVIRQISPYLPKLNLLVQDATPISILNLRAAVQTPASRELERQLTLLAIERLGRERQLFILERRKMLSLAGENELNGLDDSSFWSGRYLLEGTIDRDGYSEKTMTISARLIPPRGGLPQQIEINASRTNLAGAVNELAEKVLTAMKFSGGAAPWNGQDEAGQFLAEAKWAYQWDLLAKAQAASESAWALGNHTRELAELRIHAYAESVWSINMADGNVSIPAVPDAAKLPVMVRVQDLYCQAASEIFTNSDAVDRKWYLDGISVACEAIAVLDGFHQAAELRAGNEELLAELRRAARRTLALLDARAPMLLERLQPNTIPQGSPWSGDVVTSLKKFDRIRWDEGGVLFDRPEQSLPWFRKMLEEGYTPKEQPRIVGWTRQDGKHLRQIAKRFVEELRASTNPAARLSGLSLDLAQTPFYPEADFHAREQDMVTGLWDYRDWIFSRPEHAVIINRVEDILRDKYNEPDIYTYFGREPFAGARQRLRKAYLTNAAPIQNAVFNAVLLYLSGVPEVSPEEARELLPLVQKFTSQPGVRVMDSGVEINLRGIAGIAPTPVPIQANPVAPAENPMPVEFVSWTTSNVHFSTNLVPRVHSIIVRDNRLWMRVLLTCADDPFNSANIYVGINLQTHETQEIAFPAEMGHPDVCFEATKDSLFVGVQDHLARYRFHQKTWETIPVPTTVCAQIVGMDDQLYVRTRDSLLQLSTESQVAKILASSRRMPPANKIDPLLEKESSEFFRMGDKLGLCIGEQVFTFAPATQSWQRWPALPALKSNQPGGARRFFSDEGVQFLVAGFLRRERLIGLWSGAAAPELLLERHLQKHRPDPALDQLFGAPRWNWPEQYGMEFPCICAEGENLWVLKPRKLKLLLGRVDEDAITFQDDRQATLVHFENGNKSALAIPIRFEKDGHELDPFDGERLSFSLADTLPNWNVAPQGLLLISRNYSGYWLLPREELEKRLEALRRATKSESKASPAPLQKVLVGGDVLPASNSKPPGGARP